MELKPNFTPRAQEAIINSKKIAEELDKRVISEDHLCLSVSKIQSLSLIDFYSTCGVKAEDLEKFIRKRLKQGANHEKKKPYFSTGFKSILGRSLKIAEKFEHDFVGLEHILLAILEKENCSLTLFLKSAGISSDQASLAIKTRFLISESDMSRRPSPEKDLSPAEIEQKPQTADLKYTTNFNELAAQGKFDRVIGRNEEVKDMSEVLCRRSKNNPILLGEPGVGKTAVVEGLSQQIVDGKCTDFLLNKTIYALDLAAMIAGTKYRGQFEERLKKTMEEISKNKNIVLFIDEIHTIVGAGSAEGTMDAANILKPLLARGEIMCIGATTRNEYKKSILKDGALDRRFQPILVEEPNKKDCIEILNGIKDRYEKFHGVIYKDSAINLSVELSNRYINDRQLPDKAIDLLDQAGSKAKIRSFKRPEKAVEMEQQIAELYSSEEKSSEPHIVIKKREQLIKDYTSLIEKWADQSAKQKVYVTNEDIYKVLTQKTGIPNEDLSETEKNKILKLEENLNKKVIGQKNAINLISKSILRSKAGLGDKSKPMGSFLFLGASGVGKTYLAKQIADLIFGGESNLIQFDMSEFTEKSSSSKLLGASPGYVGFEESSSIVDSVKKRPYSVILFDEIEKAHPEVNSLLLQIMEEGSITDSSSRTASFKNCVIIMTGNIGSNLTKKTNTVGFGAATSQKEDTQSKIKEEASKILKPELINRVDGIAIFENFNEKNLQQIVALECNKLALRAEEKIHSIKFNKSILNFITEQALKENDGARPIKKIIKNYIENPLAEKILQSDSIEKPSFSISYTKSQVNFKKI
jgi:ATP-dependent Clp protease ATP-binding subunit ClpC